MLTDNAHGRPPRSRFDVGRHARRRCPWTLAENGSPEAPTGLQILAPLGTQYLVYFGTLVKAVGRLAGESGGPWRLQAVAL